MSDTPETLAEGRFLRLQKHSSGWEWAERTNASAIVGLVALTDAGAIVLVEQYRIPVGAHCIELPAGLAGDIPGEEHEALELAAARELVEETGYHPNTLQRLTEAAPSAGMCREVHTLFLATDLQRVGTGGGDSTEDITVHEVPLDGLWPWLEAQRQLGKMISMSLYAGLYAASQTRRSQ